MNPSILRSAGILIVAFALGAVPILRSASHSHSGSPYVGEERRALKALADSEVGNLLAGRGMGFAKTAELNAHPGPMHVLELAAGLELTPDQQAALAEVMRDMRAAAITLGRQLVDREGELEELFAGRHATVADVTRLTAEIGRLQGALRATHLNAHVTTTKILSAHQVGRYVALRGYASAH